MPQTLSSSTGLCPVSEFLKRVDPLAVGKLASDNAGIPVAPSALATDPNVLAALQDASGLFETAVSKGGRYSQLDLAVITAAPLTAAYGTMVRIITDLAWFFLFQRRPNKDVPAPPSFEYSMALLDQLRDGDKVFPFLETEAAGVLELVEATVDDVDRRNTASYQARDFFGQRSDRDRGCSR